MNKKILNLVLAVILAFTFVATTAVCALAADPSLTVTKVNETPTTVTVAVGVSGNKGIGALGVNLSYESTLLSYEGTESAGVAKSAGMAVYGTPSENNVRIVVEEGGSGGGAKADGSVCLVTFKKLSTVEDGSKADFNASSISALTYNLDGEEVEIADGSAGVSLKKVETTTKKPATTTKPTTTKKPATTTKPTTTKKPVVTAKPITTKPNVVSPTLPGVTVLTTVPETTEETTTEEWTTEEWTTEYESYSYTAPADVEDEIDDEKSDTTKRIVAVIVVVVCVGAAAALYFTRRK